MTRRADEQSTLEVVRPGNVRQLRNVVRQLMIAGRDAEEMGWGHDLARLLPDPGTMTGTHVAAAPLASAPPPAAQPRKRYRKASEVSEDELICALRAHGYRLGPTAKALNISRTRLYALVEASDRVRKASDLTADEISAALEASGGKLDAAAAQLEVSAHALKIRVNALDL